MREDYLFKSFVSHDLVRDEYQIPENEIPQTIEEGENSSVEIIRAIAFLVKELERGSNRRSSNIQRDLMNELNSIL